MTDTFTWRANVGSTGDADFTIAKSQFGDGYSQIVPLGLNSEAQKWRVVYGGYKSQVTPVRDFIRAHVGVPFFWKPPLEAAVGLFTCSKYSVDPQGGYYVITMEFEQANAP